jgi:hypothetical protein
MQNRACGGASVPHDGQLRASDEPHAMQKRASAGLAFPHDGQATSAAMVIESLRPARWLYSPAAN